MLHGLFRQVQFFSYLPISHCHHACSSGRFPTSFGQFSIAVHSSASGKNFPAPDYLKLCCSSRRRNLRIYRRLAAQPVDAGIVQRYIKKALMFWHDASAYQFHKTICTTSSAYHRYHADNEWHKDIDGR